jgi:hypothetical protein
MFHLQLKAKILARTDQKSNQKILIAQKNSLVHKS